MEIIEVLTKPINNMTAKKSVIEVQKGTLNVFDR